MILKFLKKVYNLFKKHPSSLGETYWQHMLKAVKFSILFGTASVICFIHALFPFLFVNTATGIAKNIIDCNEARGEDE